jgi:hypothetical protein
MNVSCFSLPLDRIVYCFGQECFLLSKRNFFLLLNRNFFLLLDRIDSCLWTGMFPAFVWTEMFYFCVWKKLAEPPHPISESLSNSFQPFYRGNKQKISPTTQTFYQKIVSWDKYRGHRVIFITAGETNSIKGLGHHIYWAFPALYGKSRPK